MASADGEAGGSPEAVAPAARSGAAALFVGLGIFLSRVIGLVRERVLATYFGTGLHADVFSAGLRLPNVLQNLLGEGTLSASFIPAYSALLGQGRTAEAGRVAGAAFALLLSVAGAISLLGLALAPFLVSVFTPGFEGVRRELLIVVVRIVFPMTGVLVLSAWALGILNSHRKFFLPYFAPVLWNAAIIGTLIAFAARLDLDALVVAAAWGALAGGALQFLVQLPAVLRLDREIRLSTGRNEPAFREAVRKAGPAIMGRGVVQLSGYLDLVLASLLAIGAVARLRYAQTLYLLPISLFAMSVAAAALPELARDRDGAAGALRERTVAAVRRVAFFVVPSFVAFVAIGDVLVAGLYRAGEFGAADVEVVWLILVAYSLGLLASTTTRVYQSAFFALRDTATPARVAFVRVLVALAAGAVLMVQFEPVTVLGRTIPAGMLASYDAAGLPLGPLGLAAGASLGAWIEWALLKRALVARLGGVAVGAAAHARMFAAALAAGGAAYLAHRALASPQPPLAAALAAGVFGAVYFALAAALGLEQARSLPAALLRRLRRRR
ncbi:MAG TPA: murein biosynthesis integral membrane protein MurJ [Gammaproteobacteria bacterium]|nr:murein biosynthesis integral membrane protein MurJ [Gammaproteobacteria bacterium]